MPRNLSRVLFGGSQITSPILFYRKHRNNNKNKNNKVLSQLNIVGKEAVCLVATKRLITVTIFDTIILSSLLLKQKFVLNATQVLHFVRDII